MSWYGHGASRPFFFWWGNANYCHVMAIWLAWSYHKYVTVLLNGYHTYSDWLIDVWCRASTLWWPPQHDHQACMQVSKAKKMWLRCPIPIDFWSGCVVKLGRISKSGTSISITDSFVRFLLPRKWVFELAQDDAMGNETGEVDLHAMLEL